MAIVNRMKAELIASLASTADFLAKVTKFPDQDAWLTHALKTINYYRRVMWKAVLKYFNQEIGDTEFLDVMIRLIEGQMRRAWNEGMRAVGLDPAIEMKPVWEQMIQEAIQSEFNYVLKLANDIQRTRGLGLNVNKFRSRVELWVNRYTDIVNRAKVECGKEKKQKLKWKFGDTIHCPACLQLNGIVAYAKEWDNLDVRPQSPPNWALSSRPEGCIGWRCQCEFIPTNDRATVDRDLKILHAVYGR